MLHFALVQKEQERALLKQSLCPSKGGSKGGHRPGAVPQEPHGAAHHICQLPDTDHIYSRVPLHLTLDTGHGNYLHRVKWVHLGSDNKEKRSHSELKICYKRDN